MSLGRRKSGFGSGVFGGRRSGFWDWEWSFLLFGNPLFILRVGLVSSKIFGLAKGYTGAVLGNGYRL